MTINHRLIAKKKNEQKFYLHNLNSNISKKHDLCPVLVLSEEEVIALVRSVLQMCEVLPS